MRQVYFGENGILAGVRSGSVVVDMTTTEPSLALDVYEHAKTKGVFAIDAPVSGGTLGAEKAKLAIMVGGKRRIFNKVKKLLNTMGKATYVGKTGSGQVAKLANQAIVGITIGAVSEALILAEAAGANPKEVRKAIKNGFASDGGLFVPKAIPKIKKVVYAG